MSNMKREGLCARTFALASTLVLVLATLLPSVSARAAVASSLDVTQALSVTGKVPESLGTTFSYRLTRLDVASPLPEGAVGDAYDFDITGNDTMSLPLLMDGSAQRGSFSFSHAGVYSYELRCAADTSGVEGLTVDGSTFGIRISIENDAAGLRLGWIEVKDERGSKPSGVSFTHTYVGAEETGPGDAPSFLGIRLPRTGDAIWGLMKMSAVILAVGVVALLLGISARRRKRSGR